MNNAPTLPAGFPTIIRNLETTYTELVTKMNEGRASYGQVMACRRELARARLGQL